MAPFGETGTEHLGVMGLAICKGEHNAAFVPSLLTTAFIPGCCTDLASVKCRGGRATGLSGDRADIPGSIGGVGGTSGIGGVKTAGLSGEQGIVFDFMPYLRRR
jgi:hypothetical protein